MHTLIFTNAMFFLSTLSLRRATPEFWSLLSNAGFSIHALLAESDLVVTAFRGSVDIFYPRSPCGERPASNSNMSCSAVFYPRSPCGERRQIERRAADPRVFYPRSPCGERPYGRINDISRLIFLSTLSLRRATSQWRTLASGIYVFYPRSPCGERRLAISAHRLDGGFLSTLSLRRATCTVLVFNRRPVIFYPRSPCGERRFDQDQQIGDRPVFYPRSPCGERHGNGPDHRSHLRFLSTLSLRRATHIHSTSHDRRGFSIHALLAESDPSPVSIDTFQKLFLSTLSLRRATLLHTNIEYTIKIFYPRSPCGERLLCQ